MTLLIFLIYTLVWEEEEEAVDTVRLKQMIRCGDP